VFQGFSPRDRVIGESGNRKSSLRRCGGASTGLQRSAPQASAQQSGAYIEFVPPCRGLVQFGSAYPGLAHPSLRKKPRKPGPRSVPGLKLCRASGAGRSGVLMDTRALALARNVRHLAWLARIWPMALFAIDSLLEVR
jgi:hypothetical protein